jgi:hypothetical protein
MSANHTEIAPGRYGVFTPCSSNSKTWETARARSGKITETPGAMVVANLGF